MKHTPLRSASFDRPVAVVGDIHGRSDLLKTLLSRLPKETAIVVAGDVGDRGLDTRGVIDQLVSVEAIGVVGNHDQWLLAWASGRGFDTAALSPMMGGEATLRSYGIVGRTVSEIEDQRHLVSVFHTRWLLRLSVALDLKVLGHPFWVTHAGVPSTEDLRGLRAEEVVPWLAEKQPDSLIWPSNEPESMIPLDRPIIMGHVTRPQPLDLGHVIAIDTGAGTRPGGGLTAVLLPERRFVTVRG